MIGVAVAGCGYWGPRMVRVLSSLTGFEVRIVVDTDPDRLAAIRQRYPHLRTTPDFEEVLKDRDVAAVVICTPLRTHYPLAQAALTAGKHVLVEKPMTDSVKSSEALVKLADDSGLTLQVDHTFVYSPAVRKIKSIIDRGEVGEILYFDSTRINLGLFQADTNVLWDLAPHDLSIMTYLLNRKPRWLSAIGSSRYSEFEHLVYVTIMFDDSLIAHLNLNWLAPVKLRRTLIGGSKRMIVYDDLEPSEKIRVYEKGVTFTSDPEARKTALVDYRIGDMYSPHVENQEPLGTVCEEFLGAIQNGRPAPTDGNAGLEVVRLLEAAQWSLERRGKRVEL